MLNIGVVKFMCALYYIVNVIYNFVSLRMRLLTRAWLLAFAYYDFHIEANNKYKKYNSIALVFVGRQEYKEYNSMEIIFIGL